VILSKSQALGAWDARISHPTLVARTSRKAADHESPRKPPTVLVCRFQNGLARRQQALKRRWKRNLKALREKCKTHRTRWRRALKSTRVLSITWDTKVQSTRGKVLMDYCYPLQPLLRRRVRNNCGSEPIWLATACVFCSGR
jgi:hypothetical protein